MWSRRVGMLAVVLRSVHRSGLSVAAFVPPFPTATCQIVNSSKSVFGSIVSGGRPPASTAVIHSSSSSSSSSSNNNSNNSNSSGSRNLINKSSNRAPLAKETELGGSTSAAPRRRGGRGMSSGGGQRGGGGRSRGGGRARSPRSPPDYGPNRAGQHRANVSPGTTVEVVQKQDQRTGRLTSGTVSRLLTSSGFHPRGIKVMLAGGVVGRVQNIAGIDGAEPTPGNAGVNTATGYLSGSSSNGDGSGVDSRIDPAIVASSAIGIAADSATTAASAASAVSAPARSSRPVRKFRAERVQGRSWSVEGGEVVARGAGGEEIRGAGDAFDDGASLDRRRGRGGRGRGRR